MEKVIIYSIFIIFKINLSCLFTYVKDSKWANQCKEKETLCCIFNKQNNLNKDFKIKVKIMPSSIQKNKTGMDRFQDCYKA